MAQLKFGETTINENSTSFPVGFFGLKNDNDEAIVRFMHDNTDSFDILTVHNVNVGGKYRKVNCIRDPHEPIENCPLCLTGTQIQQRIFIHLLEYTKNERGEVVATPKVWERSMQYASTLKSFIDNYGPLSDVLFKVVRHGAAGNMKTTYEILPIINKTVYRDDIYVKNEAAFDNYKTIGSIVMDKTMDELNAFIDTGVFPEKSNANKSDSYSNVNDAAPQYYSQVTAYEQPTSYPNPSLNRPSPWQNATPNNTQFAPPYRQY